MHQNENSLSVNKPQQTANLSLEQTFHDALLSIRKLLRTYWHMLSNPKKFSTAQAIGTWEQNYISPIGTLIISAFFSAGFIKSMVFETLNEIKLWSVDNYDNYIKDYSLFSNIILVIGIFIALYISTFIISFFLTFLLAKIKLIPFRKNLLPSQIQFRISALIVEIKGFSHLQQYYISLYLISITIAGMATNSFDISSNNAHLITIIIESIIFCTLLLSCHYFRKNKMLAKRAYIKPASSIITKIVHSLVKTLLYFLKKVAYIFYKVVMPLIVLPFKLSKNKLTKQDINKSIVQPCRNCFYQFMCFLLLLFIVHGTTNYLCKSATKVLLIFLGQNDYRSPIQIFGPSCNDTLFFTYRKDTSHFYRFETDLCIKSGNETETLLKNNAIVQLFRTLPDDVEVSASAPPTFFLSDTNSKKSEFVKIPVGSSICFSVYTLVDSSYLEDFKNRLAPSITSNRRRDIYFKVLAIPTDRKSDIYVQHLFTNLRQYKQ